MNKNEIDLEKYMPASNIGFVGTFVSMLVIFLFIPIFLHNHYANLILQLSFAGLVTSVIYSFKANRTILITGAVLLIPFFIFDALGIAYNDIDYFLTAYVFLSIYLFFAILVLLKMTFYMPVVDTNLIFGTITIYLLVGLLWSKFYFIINAFLPGSFIGIESNEKLMSLSETGRYYLNQFNFLYYSFTTLSTLGLGDIYPIHRLAKSLTILEAMFGQLFIATIIAKVVSVWKK